jgi:hypothetical protein
MPHPRFSLRTLLIGMTVVCCLLGWLGWQWRIVQERRACFDDVSRLHPGICVAVCRGSSDPAPFARNWLGDELERVIVVNQKLGPKVFARIRAAYPEAKVISAEDPTSVEVMSIVP